MDMCAKEMYEWMLNRKRFAEEELRRERLRSIKSAQYVFYEAQLDLIEMFLGQFGQKE